MLTQQIRVLNLSGSNYEIGYLLGKMVANDERLKAKYIVKTTVDKEQIKEINVLLDRWCPGLTQEIQGFAEALQMNLESLFFYQMISYKPCCSHIALLSGKTDENKPILARNYEFSNELEDFSLMRTEVKGKYTHIGTSMLQFGRDDGFNEHGLAVTISSCGLPVVNLPHMQKPQFLGLQYWVVVRALLENCKTVKEALSYLKEMPIVFNMNMILLDKTDHAALVQTMNGRVAYRQIDSDNKEKMLHATNHTVLPEFLHLEKQAFSHSIGRYQYIEHELKDKQTITRSEIKTMLLSKYPQGLCFHNYAQSFGTTKSMILSPADGTIEICWGGRIENTWKLYDISQPILSDVYDIKIMFDDVEKGLLDWQIR